MWSFEPVTDAEMDKAARVARKQQDSAEACAVGNPYEFFKVHYYAHFMGNVGEIYAARKLGLIWQGQHITSYNLKIMRDCTDLSENVEVRSTTYRGGFLPIKKEDDKDEARVVLAIVDLENKMARLAGWIVLGEAKHKRFWRTDIRHPCFAVPQRDLNPMEKWNYNIGGKDE